jgi:hypothetical protein
MPYSLLIVSRICKIVQSFLTSSFNFYTSVCIQTDNPEGSLSTSSESWLCVQIPIFTPFSAYGLLE